MLRLGDYNRLTVVKEVSFGIYLDGGDEGEILMPKKYVPEGCKPGDELEAFLYLDKDEKLVATTQTPLAKVGDFAFLRVAWANEYGAFLDWGLTKDIFCPFREQKTRLETGDSCIVHIHIDRETHRIVASAKVERYLNTDFPPYARGDAASLLIWQKTELGFKVIIDNSYPGLVYSDQVFKRVHIGDRMTGYITAVRDDGKIDVALQPAGRAMTDSLSASLYEYIKSHGGVCRLTDKSPADDISRELHVSKKNFKKAVGDLYKRRLITIGDDALHLA